MIGNTIKLNGLIKRKYKVQNGNFNTENEMWTNGVADLFQ